MTNINFGYVNDFEFSIDYNVLHRKEHVFEIDPHVHDKCEIYVNLSGDISFMVENKIYPVKRGDAIITRPHEYHHCIYHSDAAHEHYWILFSAQGNEAILKPFFERPFGESNLITWNGNDSERLINLCETFYTKKLNVIEQQVNFWRLMELLNNSNKVDSYESQIHKTGIDESLNYIESKLTDSIRITEIARAANVSVNTIERRFYEELNMTPMEFIKKKRLNLAANLLRQGYNVQQAGMESGFNDISYFIKLFKKYYGITPLKYIKYYTDKVCK